MRTLMHHCTLHLSVTNIHTFIHTHLCVGTKLWSCVCVCVRMSGGVCATAVSARQGGIHSEKERERRRETGVTGP